MEKIIRFTGWQVRLLARYQILTIAFLIAAIYISLLISIPVMHSGMFTTLFVFLDPTALGYIFVGVIILFEKGDNTLEAQVITPMKTQDYIWSKALALMVPVVICSTGIAFSTQGFQYRIIPFYTSVILTSLIFTFIGIAGVMHVRTFNQYIVVIPLAMAPTALPLLNFFGLTDWKILFIIPTQSTLNLLSASFAESLSWTLLLDFAYLCGWTWLSYLFARRQFEKIMYR